MNKPRIAVFMPARNESKTIEQNLEVLKKGIASKRINYAVLVIDGSNDGTAEISFRKLGLEKEQIGQLTKKKRGTIVLPNGFVIIHHKEPEGKGRNFLEAVFSLKGRTDFFKNPDSVLVNVDADAQTLKVEKLTEIAKEVSKRNVPMLLGTAFEKNARGKPIQTRQMANGFRAIKAATLQPMFRFDEKWVRTLPRGFALEYALNLLVYAINGRGKKTIPSAEIKLLHENPGKHEPNSMHTRRRQDVAKRFHRTTKQLNFPGPHALAFYEKAKTRKFK